MSSNLFNPRKTCLDSDFAGSWKYCRKSSR